MPDKSESCAEATTVSTLIRRYSRPSSSFDRHEHEKMAKLCEVVKHFMKSEAISMITRRYDEPIMMFYSADSSPASTKELYAASMGATTVRRKGRRANDLLVQRMFLLAPDGECKVVVDEPRTMCEKTAWCHTEAFRRMFPNPRNLGHRSIVVIHGVWDRAIQAACARQVAQSKKADDANELDIDFLPAALKANLTWTTSGACSCHDAHNALKWSITEYCAEPTILRGLFISIESLRNGMSLLMDHMRPWLVSVLVYEDDHMLPHSEFWTLLGLAPRIVEVASELQIRYDGGKLRVAARWEGDSQVWNSIELVLMHIWAFKKYSESRWLSLGPSCRCMVGALATGIRDFVEWVLAKPGTSRYYLGGFTDFWSKSVAHLVGVVAMSSFPADAALSALLEDDRIATTLAALEDDLKLEVRFVHNIAGEIWDFVGAACMWDAVGLRNASMASSLTACGFMMWRLRFLHELPWTLTRGDISANLKALEQDEEPADETSAKIWRLCRMHYPRDDIIQGVRLLANASFSSEQVEQGHSFAANIMKRHREYGSESLRVRSLISSVRTLVELSPVEKKLNKATKQLCDLARRRPKHFTGRQFYFQQLRCLASSWARDGRTVAPDVSKRLMTTHAASWSAMAPEHRRQFEAKAAGARLELEWRLDEEKARLQGEVALLGARAQEEERGNGLPLLRMSAGRWGQSDLCRLQGLFDDKVYTVAKVEQMRQQVRPAVGPPSLEVQSYLSGLAIGAVAKAAKPPWLGLVCRQRAFFSTCVFKFSAGPDEVVFVRPTFIRQVPFVVGFVRLTMASEAELKGASSGSVHHNLRDWNHVFSIDSESFCFSDDGGFDEGWSVSVLTDSVVRAGGFVVAEAEWKDIGEVRDWFPDVESAVVCDEEGAPLATKSDSIDLAWVKLPWLLEHFPGHGHACQGKATASAKDDMQVSGAGEEEAPGEHEVLSAEDVVDALYERRFLMQGGDQASIDFRVQLRGGQWTARHTGKAYDSFRGCASPGEPTQMCALYNMGTTATFAVKAYSEVGAQRLAELWCHRMQWCLDVWRASDCEAGFMFTDGDMASYEEPEVGVAVEDGLRAAFQRRLASIRAIRPR